MIFKARSIWPARILCWYALYLGEYVMITVSSISPDDNGVILCNKQCCTLRGLSHPRGNVYDFWNPGILNCVGRSASSRSSFLFFQRIRDHIRPVSKAVKKTIALTAKPGIGAEDKLAAVKIPDHFGL